MPKDLDAFEVWLRQGQEAGWCSRLICFTHDTGASEEELQMFDDGHDPCIWAVRVDPDGTA